MACYTIDKRLIPIKLLAFLIHGAVYAIVPLLLTFMVKLNLSAYERFVILSTSTLSACLGFSLIGFLCDKLSKFRLILGIILVCATVVNNLSLLIPERETVTRLVDHATISFASKRGINLEVEPCFIRYPQWCPEMKDNFTFRVVNCKTKWTHDSARTFKVCFLREDDNSSTTCFESDVDISVVEETWGNGYSKCNYQLRNVSARGKWYGKVSASTIVECDANIIDESDFVCHEYRANGLSFWSYFFFAIFIMLCVGTALPMIEAVILLQMRTCGSGATYGQQRVWGFVSVAFVIPLALYSLHIGIRTREEEWETKGLIPFYPMFIVFFILMCLALAVLIFGFQSELREAKPHLHFLNLWRMDTARELGLMLFAMFCLGAIWGYSHIFIPLYETMADSHFGDKDFYTGYYKLEEHLLIWTPSVLIISFIDYLFIWLGQVNVLTFGLISIGILPLLQSHFVITDTIASIVHIICMAAAVTYSTTITEDLSYIFTIQSLIYAVHYGLGVAAGCWVAVGFHGVFENYDFDIHIIFAACAILMGLLYRLGYFLLVSNRSGNPSVPLESNDNPENENTVF